MAKEEKSIWKVNVLKFVATNKCNLDIKSSLHFPQFCYCFTFLAPLDFKITFIWMNYPIPYFSTCSSRVQFLQEGGKSCIYISLVSPSGTGWRLWCQYCWCLIRSEDRGWVANGGREWGRYHGGPGLATGKLATRARDSLTTVSWARLFRRCH